jgi:ATP-dependent Lhr-like helicase
VFRKHDPDNLLLSQAEHEVLRQELDIARLADTLARLATLRLDLQALQRPSPLSFPLVVEFLREQLSTEKLADRIARMLADLERAAGPATGEASAGLEAEQVAEVARFGMTDHATANARTGRGSGSGRTHRPRKISKPLPLL